MRNRVVWFLVGAVLVGALALFGSGLAVASMHGAFGTSGTAGRQVSQESVAFGVSHVFIRQDAYSPSHIEVLLGTTVTWTNQDNVPHSVIVAPVVISAANMGESRLLSPGQSFSYTFTSDGTFKYACTEHPNMTGVVIVM
jgi:plastocyanin